MDNTICLTCLPNMDFEDNSIANTTAMAELTVKEIRAQIAVLKKERTTNLANCRAFCSEEISSVFFGKELDSAEGMKKIVEKAAPLFIT